MRTPVCELLGIEQPIVQAPMSDIIPLAAAVSNAGALGMVTLTWSEDVGAVVRAVAALTTRPFGGNLILTDDRHRRLDQALEAGRHANLIGYEGDDLGQRDNLLGGQSLRLQRFQIDERGGGWVCSHQLGVTQHRRRSRGDAVARGIIIDCGGERSTAGLVGETRAIMRRQRGCVVKFGDAQGDREALGRRQTTGIGGIEKHGVRRLRASARFRASGAQLVQRRALGNAQHGVDDICGESGHAACSPFVAVGEPRS